VKEKFGGPGGAVCKISDFRSKRVHIMFGSCSRELPMIPQPVPQTTSCWCSFHQHNFLAVAAMAGDLGCGPAAKFTVDHASIIL